MQAARVHHAGGFGYFDKPFPFNPGNGIMNVISGRRKIIG